MGKYTSKQEIIEQKRELRDFYDTHQLIGDSFGAGMYADLVGAGWDDPQEIRELYKPVGEEKRRPIDGVIMVTSKTPKEVETEVKIVRDHFRETPDSDGPLVYFYEERVGRALPCKKEQ